MATESTPDMRPPAAAGTRTRLDEGWTALQDRRWADARDIFRRAVTRRPSAEAFEGLSWAAWWLDQAEAVFEARERAFHAYRDEGDAAGAARLATWLAADHLDFAGAPAIASGWLDRARRLLDTIEPGAEHGWLAFHQGYIASVRGDAREAQRCGALAAEHGRRSGIVDLEMLGLALQGMTLVSRGRVPDGMRCLDEASTMALADEATIPISSAWTCCFLVTACARVLDFDRAFAWCDRIESFAERYGSRYMLGFCRLEYATIHLWRGRWAEAEHALEDSVTAFSASRPGMVGGALVGLAELRRRQGRATEALRLLERAGVTAAAQVCRGWLALDDGDAQRALELGERVHRGIAADCRVERVPALELIARAQVALGAFEDAAAACARLTSIARTVGTTGLTATARTVEGVTRAAAGDPGHARPLLEDALDGFERCGARFDAACTRVELALTLAMLRRDDDARREAALAHRELSALGAAPAATRARAVLDGERPSASGSSPGLSPRETEVLALLTDGLTNRAIATRLRVSEHTVHRHVTSILRKLDVPSRTAAATLALRRRLLDRT